MEMIKDALIKEALSGGDRVFIVEELPKELLLRKIPKVKLSNYGDTVEQIPDEFTDEPIDGVRLSQTGDGGFVFDGYNNTSKGVLETIDRYIMSRLPNNARKPVRTHYCTRPGDPASPAKPLSQVLRVTFDAPPATQVVAQASLPNIEELKAQLMAEILPIAVAKAEETVKAKTAAAAKTRMAKVRDAKKEKKKA